MAQIARPPLQARVVAVIIGETFDDFHHEFRGLTERAQSRFERREWRDAHDDSLRRLELYRAAIGVAAERLATELETATIRREVWVAAKSVYAQQIADTNDFEIAETFFNSVTRQVFTTIGVDDNLEFVWFGAASLPRGLDNSALFEVHHRPSTMSMTATMVESILTAYDFAVPYEDVLRDASRIADRLDARLAQVWETPTLDTIDMMRPVFFRNKGAYLIGRVRARNRIIPFIVALLNTPNGIVVDTVLLSEVEASRIFSFTRSYFHVSWPNPAELVGFVKSLLPMKPIAELFNSIGYPSHGKTMLYRALYRHLQNSTDLFEPARGTKGKVMTVFTLPSYDVVFKVIRDEFAPPKRTTADEVRDKYRLVSRHDRVGRMVDAQEFENLSFDRSRFSDELVAELISVASHHVRVTDDHVVIAHLYAERRLYPLDLYLTDVRGDRARRAVREYGRAIKDLAAADLFPGDVSTKNFGVTRHGGVVFYDYDEIQILSNCRFVTRSESTDGEDKSGEPFGYSVANNEVYNNEVYNNEVYNNEVYPEALATVIDLPVEFRPVFHAEHGDLFTVAFWRGVQDRNAVGELIDFFPYPEELRFDHPS